MPLRICSGFPGPAAAGGEVPCAAALKNLEDVDIRLRFAVHLANLIFWVLLLCSLPNTKADNYVRVIPAVYPDETTTTTAVPPPKPVQVDVDSYFTDYNKGTTTTTTAVPPPRPVQVFVASYFLGDNKEVTSTTERDPPYLGRSEAIRIKSVDSTERSLEDIRASA